MIVIIIWKDSNDISIFIRLSSKSKPTRIVEKTYIFKIAAMKVEEKNLEYNHPICDFSNESATSIMFDPGNKYFRAIYTQC